MSGEAAVGQAEGAVPPALRTRITRMLGCRFPIIQTGMGWVATPELVAAVCNAGGFGFLAAATLTPAETESAIRRTRELTDRPFGVNFLMEQPGADEIADIIVRLQVRAAGYNRSPRAEIIRRFKDAGVLCVPTIGAVRHARKAVELGADILICQGGEGGGHTGSVATTVLLPQVVDAVSVPVAAAGGFRDGRGLVAALAFGASGVAMGTRFLLTAESPLPAPTAERYFAASVDDILVTSRVDGLPQRVIRNELVRRLESSSGPVLLLRALRSALAYRRMTGASLGQLLSAAMSMRRGQKLTRAQMIMAANAPILVRRAMVDGVPDEGVLPTGMIAGTIADRPSCGELIRGIVEEAARVLDRLQHAEEEVRSCT